MRRCPQCDFIYEESQVFCDMDGAKLFHDPHALPEVEEAAPLTAGRAAQSRRRWVTVLSVAAVLIGAFLASAYYVSTRQEEPKAIAHQATELAAVPRPTRDRTPTPVAPVRAPAHGESPTPDVQPPTRANRKAAARDSAAARPSPTPSPSPAPRPREKKRAPQPEQKPQEESASRKKDSKLVSALKKTGRALKRPFKF